MQIKKIYKHKRFIRRERHPRAAPKPWMGGEGASYYFTKSYNKKKTIIFTTQIQVVYF
jgi:hypothetical protein